MQQGGNARREKERMPQERREERAESHRLEKESGNAYCTETCSTAELAVPDGISSVSPAPCRCELERSFLESFPLSLRLHAHFPIEVENDRSDTDHSDRDFCSETQRLPRVSSCAPSRLQHHSALSAGSKSDLQTFPYWAHSSTDSILHPGDRISIFRFIESL